MKWSGRAVAELLHLTQTT